MRRFLRDHPALIWALGLPLVDVGTNETYKAIYNQRTEVERLFSQAVALGIERPKLRNQLSIANLTTLTFILINLRTMQRIPELLPAESR